MYVQHRLRLESVTLQIRELLVNMALDPRGFPGVTPGVRQALKSSASTPSLRSRDSELVVPMPPDNGGNVRVVVRVRGFLPRGEFYDLRYLHTGI